MAAAPIASVARIVWADMTERLGEAVHAVRLRTHDRRGRSRHLDCSTESMLSLSGSRARRSRGAWTAAAVITLTVTVIAGLLMRVTDPSNFPNIGLGLWWAVQTTSTAGYGDVVPTSVAGRAIAALVMLVGIGFITVSTAGITSAFLESARRRREVGPTIPSQPRCARLGTK
jgi:voltage-gated potassium channel Kch